ncbi:hypothetical protein KY285_031743 [Solanum tuberosum]|nr:hypothetical protein KY284_031526 [Solanum tuberosum]KAH0656861.1 hypothetical protein KY285_031743 [Solanum tuberosum]
MYNSSLSTSIKVPSGEIKKLATMLPSYLHDSGFFYHSERTDWSSLDTYKDKQTDMLLGPQHDFEVEFVQDIMQQESDSLDCGIFVAAFAEFLSDRIPISKIEFHSEYLHTRYAALLCKYGTEKVKAG